ncbi:MAG: efflux RND transporter periplasmic adaptor subunit [Myxococcota bacterium]
MKTIPLISLTLVLVACEPREQAPGPPASPAPVQIQVRPVTSERLRLPVRVSGPLAAKDEQKLSFKLGGVIDRVMVEEGDAVRRGQVIAALKLSEIDAQVASAQLGLEKARRDLDRVKKLEQAKVATREQLEDAETGFEVAQNQLEIARFNREYAVITAPASGRILKKLATPGELIAPGSPVFILGATERGWVLRVAVTDRERVRVKLGDPAQLRFDAFGEAPVEARVTELASAPSPLTGTYEVELLLGRGEDRLVTGLFGRGEILPSQAEQLTLIPPSALLEADGHRGLVYVLSPDRQTLERKEVELGAIHGELVGVQKGLADGQEVVVGGSAYLRTGSPFVVVDGGDVAQAH